MLTVDGKVLMIDLREKEWGIWRDVLDSSENWYHLRQGLLLHLFLKNVADLILTISPTIVTCSLRSSWAATPDCGGTSQRLYVAFSEDKCAFWPAVYVEAQSIRFGDGIILRTEVENSFK